MFWLFLRSAVAILVVGVRLGLVVSVVASADLNLLVLVDGLFTEVLFGISVGRLACHKMGCRMAFVLTFRDYCSAVAVPEVSLGYPVRSDLDSLRLIDWNDIAHPHLLSGSVVLPSVRMGRSRRLA